LLPSPFPFFTQQNINLAEPKSCIARQDMRD